MSIKRLLILRLFAFLLLLMTGGVANEVWAAKVTYHILTLPIDSTSRYNYHMKAAIHGHRLEAIKIVVDNQTTVELPAHYKSPLATNFKYYKPEDITIGAVTKLFDNPNNPNKGIIYDIKAGSEEKNVAEGTVIAGTTAEYYVVYTYNESNTIAKLDGSVSYNIATMNKDKGVYKDKGFFAYNRGRNNRPAVVPTAKVDPEMLASPDFMKVESPGAGISTYWANGDNKNKKEEVESQFHFIFRFEGLDPYNIIIRNTYDSDLTYIEKNDDGDKKFVYKWYKGGQLFSVGTANSYIASDIHKRYLKEYDSAIPNPTDLIEGTDYINRNGQFHGQGNAIWSSYAILNNNDNNGYVFMGTRTVDGNGATPDAPYYLKEANNLNNLVLNKVTAENASNNLSIKGLYPIKKLTFKVPTSFYDPESPSDAHIVSVADWVSQYTVENDPIETKYLPAALKRKYCTFNGKFYSDAARTHEITYFSQATEDPIEGYQVYLGYDVSASIPFKAITPSASYTTATWYELTDAGSTQEYGRKIKNNAGTYKNNGGNGEYAKESEFAFVGDPYELKVLYRKGSEDASANTYVTLSTYDTWQIPVEAVSGSFLLQKYKGTGYWNWDVGQPTGSVTYQSNLAYSAGKDAQTITFTVSGLNGSKYLKVTTGGTGTDVAQIVSVTPTVGSVVAETGTTATVTVSLAENTGAAKTMTVTIQEYNDNEGSSASGTASVITITQGTSPSSFAGNTVDYHATNSTYVKPLELPKKTFTYKIVDRTGRIAVTASASQTIFSPLSLASIPSIIVSPFIVDEIITFYSSFDSGSGAGTGTSRTHLSTEIKETPPANAAIYVKYETARLNAKPFKLNEDQEIFVRLNGQYIYYDAGTLKSSAESVNDDRYKWKLRNRDPYAMLIDNMGARTHLGVTGNETISMPIDDNGTMDSQSRQKGAWVDVATIENAGALSFTTTRAYAQQFIAKSSARTGVYEVMVATGDGVDASSTYYNIGRPEENTIKIYSNATYQATDDDEIKFRLEENVTYIYHLIDKANHELLTLESKSPELVLPAEYQSPLVGAANYSYYSRDLMTIDTSKDPDEYTPTNPAVKLTAITDLDAQFPGGVVASDGSEYTAAATENKHEVGSESDIENEAKKLTTTGYHYYNVNNGTSYKKVNITRAYRGTDIYVTYTVNDLIGFNNTGKVNDHPYLLKFLEPFAGGYYLEDGADKLTTEKIEAIYPYCNGDGNMNIYGEVMRDEQMGGGSSTRPRWVWFFESANNDPYHVRIHSRSTISYKNVSHPTYLQTYAVHFNQDSDPDTEHVVSGGGLPGVASETPTEYMILGLPGAYKLLTTQEISADEDGDGEITISETKRREVRSLEQYWKTYNMLKLHVLGISASTDEYSTDESTWKVPEDLRDDLETALVAKGIGAGQWHSYDAYANATRWNGYNDKAEGHEKKVVEKLEHWFQTFDMGNGTFNVEDADIPPVLVLLDQHGWEIMRKPLPVTNYPLGDEELAALRAYDSPMVESYYFYSNATKATGCHKYTLRMQNGAERDQIKVNGVRYSSTSLGNLPPANASGVKSSGVLNDQFVIYTVKEEYAGNYDYNLDYSGNEDDGYTITSETGTSQPYIMLQHGRFYKTQNSKSDNTSYFTKPISEHTTPEGGNVYDMIISPHNHGANNDNIINGSGNFIGNNFWYLKPNLNIDQEMGIKWGSANSGSEPLSKAATQVTYENKSGFDPYNVQLQLVNNNDGTPANKFLTTHMTSARLENGIMVGDYSGSGGTTKITLEDAYSYASYDPMDDSGGSTGYDHTNLHISNQTFMVVQDANGNMQLMPRFDHTKRVSLDNVSPWETQLSNPEDHAKASADDNSSQGSQTTFFVRPQRFIYHIIDNKGREALRYTRGGDNYPTITEHFKSPLATDFTYYTGLATYETPVSSSVGEWNNANEFQRSVTTEALMNSQIKLLPNAGTYYYRIGTRGVFTYKSVVVTKGLLEQQITGSFAALENFSSVENEVYVRYNYDEDADREADRILLGQWFTVKLAGKDLQADGTVVTTVGSTQGTGVNLYAGEASSRSLTAVDNTEYGTKRDALTATGDYYFRVGTNPSYTYNKVTVTTVPISSASDYTETLDGSYATEWSNSKPLVVDADGKKWQWKFLQAPTDPSSDYYEVPDPYAVQIYNRMSNYTTDPSMEPSPMGVAIKVPNGESGADRFALLSHPNGGYALAVAKTYGSDPYLFLNGANMSTSVAATTFTENRHKITVANESKYTEEKDALNIDGEYYYKYGETYKKVTVTGGGVSKAEENISKTIWDAGDTYNFTYKTNALSPGTQVLVEDDVVYHYTYYVINNSSKLAITAEQNNAEALSHDFYPYLPQSAQTPLLNMDDYKYYGFSRPAGLDTYAVIPQTILYTLYGLYDDNVWVRYDAYDVDKTNFKVPNRKTIVASHVARDPESVDASLNINGGLPYNIIWYNDKMMKSTGGTTISDGGSQSLTGTEDYVWYITGNDPYALKIKHKAGKFVDGTSTLVADSTSAMRFMLLKKTGFDYGVLQVTGTTGDNAGKKLTGYGNELTADASTDPTKFIIFGLSVHDLIYRLIIAKTCPDKKHPNVGEYVEIPYRDGDDDDYTVSYKWQGNEKKNIFGTSQRNLTAVNEGEGDHIAGEKYQLGETISWGGTKHVYCYNAGPVSIGDDLWVPNVFYRPNCTFDFYVEGIYDSDRTTAQEELNNRFKGLKLSKLMSASELIDKTVVVNIVYSFNKELTTNSGLDFVTSKEQNLWYTFETPEGETPYLAQYTNAWGLQAKPGRATRYTNDYLWTPLGDVYGFKMFNRYMIKNSNSETKVMTYPGEASDELNLLIAEPGTGSYTAGNEVFELLPGDMDGYFRVHPVANTGEPKYYVRRGASDYAVLSTTPSDWTFGLDMTLLEPYYERAGYIGGLNEAGKTAYETALAKDTIKIIDLQEVVYNDANIVHYTPGYYRMHSQPGVSGIAPVRYASGYLHETEKTAVSGGTPMHFYSKAGVSTTFAGEDGLSSGFTVTPATRGEIPVDSTEDDPSTIFYFSGNGTTDTYGNPTSIIQTQGLYVAANPNGDGDNGTKTGKLQRAVMSDNSENAINFSVMDIGGAVLLIHDGSAPATRRYLNFDQSVADSIYDLRYYHESPTDDAKWCLKPVQKTRTAGNGEMPLRIKTHNGGDGYYYSTFYAPFDVLLPADAGGHTYNAYICKKWHNEGVNPVAVPAFTVNETNFEEGKFVPAATPVIIRTNDESEYVTLTLPTTLPSSPLSSCIFTGSYLETLLLASDPARDVYTLGLPMTSEVSKDGDYVTSGGITAPLPEFANNGVGFYINATPNKEDDALQSLWKRNNLYVQHNKIYYRYPGGVSAPKRNDPLYVPVLFGDVLEFGNEDEAGKEEQFNSNAVYDLQGRRVVSGQSVIDGTWRESVTPGIYIYRGKKLYIK